MFRGLDGQHRSSARGGAARSIKRTATGAALTMTTLLTLVTLSGAGCGDDDTITPGGGGSGGRAGSGSGGGGGGGRAGTGGGGSGGTGGVAGTGGGSGSGGSSGTGGSSGSGGSVSDPDGGVDPDGGDGGPQLSARQQILTAYCARLDEVSGCEPAADCVEAQEGFYTGFLEVTPNFDECVDEADAYFACQSTAPLEEFECADGAPQYTVGSPTCDDEEAAFLEGLGSEDGSPCID